MDEIASAFSDGSWQSLFYPLDYPLSDWDKVVIDEKRLKLLKGGNSIQLEGRTSDAERLRAYNLEGSLVAILKFNADTCLWQHDILFTC
jgi:tRNA U55 pseudouridine synthase TruB